MDLFVGTALLNACHRLAGQLGDAESLISTTHGPEPEPSPQTHFQPGWYVCFPLHTCCSLVSIPLNTQSSSVVVTEYCTKAPVQGLCQAPFKVAVSITLDAGSAAAACRRAGIVSGNRKTSSLGLWFTRKVFPVLVTLLFSTARLIIPVSDAKNIHTSHHHHCLFSLSHSSVQYILKDGRIE